MDGGFGGADGFFVESFLEAEAFFPFWRSAAFSFSIFLNVEGVAIVAEAGLEHFGESSLACFVFDGGHEFDAFFEVAGHEVGGGDEDDGVISLLKIVDAGVFEVAIDDGDDFDVFGGFA